MTSSSGFLSCSTKPTACSRRCGMPLAGPDLKARHLMVIKQNSRPAVETLPGGLTPGASNLCFSWPSRKYFISQFSAHTRMCMHAPTHIHTHNLLNRGLSLMIEPKSMNRVKLCSINNEMPTICGTLYAHFEVCAQTVVWREYDITPSTHRLKGREVIWNANPLCLFFAYTISHTLDVCAYVCDLTIFSLYKRAHVWSQTLHCMGHHQIIILLSVPTAIELATNSYRVWNSVRHAYSVSSLELSCSFPTALIKVVVKFSAKLGTLWR